MLSKDYILEVTPENLLDNSQGELEALLKWHQLPNIENNSWESAACINKEFLDFYL